jgi:hypothetical protein
MGWILPVGTPGGINSGFDGVRAGSGIVRLGTQLLCLDLDMYRLWRAAAAAPEIGRFISWGAAEGISDVPDRVRALEAAGLLVEDGPDVKLRIGCLALRLIGECLGNGAEANPAFLVLGRNRAQLQVDANLFEVLLRSDGVSPVSVTCDTLDAARLESERRPHIEMLTEGLPVLVRNEVILLEAAVR